MTIVISQTTWNIGFNYSSQIKGDYFCNLLFLIQLKLKKVCSPIWDAHFFFWISLFEMSLSYNICIVQSSRLHLFWSVLVSTDWRKVVGYLFNIEQIISWASTKHMAVRHYCQRKIKHKSKLKKKYTWIRFNQDPIYVYNLYYLFIVVVDLHVQYISCKLGWHFHAVYRKSSKIVDTWFQPVHMDW